VERATESAKQLPNSGVKIKAFRLRYKIQWCF